MMYQCLSQMSYEALSTRPLCSVESYRSWSQSLMPQGVASSGQPLRNTPL